MTGGKLLDGKPQLTFEVMPKTPRQTLFKQAVSGIVCNLYKFCLLTFYGVDSESDPKFVEHFL